MRYEFGSTKISADLLVIIKRYNNANEINRIRLCNVFHKTLNNYYDKGDISDDEFCTYYLLYYNLITRRNGFKSEFCKKAYYPHVKEF